jgi:dUTP pyrophosphatase
MTDLYLCVPDDSSYYMYCDQAYKHNERDPGERDSGFDVYCEKEVYMNRGDTAFLKFGITAACAVKERSGIKEPRAYWLMPRSSISKTPFVCANSMGLIDSGYRGPLMGAIKMLFGDNLETIKTGTRLFQIVSGSAKPWRRIIIVRSVEEFPKPGSERGSGGFGSTGVGYGTTAPFSPPAVFSTGTGSGATVGAGYGCGPSCASGCGARPTAAGTGSGSGSGSGYGTTAGAGTASGYSYFENNV